jgi:hypothetical protein
MTDALLERHKPVLKYDSQESYFADAAAIWTATRATSSSARTGACSQPGRRLEPGVVGETYLTVARHQGRSDRRPHGATTGSRRGGCTRSPSTRTGRTATRCRRGRRPVAALLVLLLPQRLQTDRPHHPRRAARGRLGGDPDPASRRCADRAVYAQHARAEARDAVASRPGCPLAWHCGSSAPLVPRLPPSLGITVGGSGCLSSRSPRRLTTASRPEQARHPGSRSRLPAAVNGRPVKGTA